MPFCDVGEYASDVDGAGIDMKTGLEEGCSVQLYYQLFGHGPTKVLLIPGVCVAFLLFSPVKVNKIIIITVCFISFSISIRLPPAAAGKLSSRTSIRWSLLVLYFTETKSISNKAKESILMDATSIITEIFFAYGGVGGSKDFETQTNRQTQWIDLWTCCCCCFCTGVAATYEAWGPQLLALCGTVESNEEETKRRSGRRDFMPHCVHDDDAITELARRRKSSECETATAYGNGVQVCGGSFDGAFDDENRAAAAAASSGTGVQVCAFDNRGVGRSSAPKRKKSYT